MNTSMDTSMDTTMGTSMDISMDTFNLSGAVGINIFSQTIKNPKKIYILYDNHQNTNYCKNSSICIGDFFNLIQDAPILLEESFINKRRGDSLWSQSPHINNFSRFYKEKYNQKNIHPIDIRDCLSERNVYFLKGCRLTLKEYLKPLMYLFNLYPRDSLESYFTEIKTIKQEFYTILDNNTKKIFYKLKHRLTQFLCLYRSELDTSMSDLNEIKYPEEERLNISYPFDSAKVMDHPIVAIEMLHMATMELFCVSRCLKLLNSHNNVFIYTGFIHSSRISKWLSMFGHQIGYKLLSSQGTTFNNFNNNTELKDIKGFNSCVAIS